MSLAALGNGVVAVAAAFLAFPGTAFAVDLPAPVAEVVDALPVPVPEVAAPAAPAVPSVPAVVEAVPLPQAPAPEPEVAAVRPSAAAPAPAPARTAPIHRNSPHLDARPATRAPASAVRPQRRSKRTARAAEATPASEATVLKASARQIAAESANTPFPAPEPPALPSASTVSSSGTSGSALAFVALLVGMFLLAVPELGARAPLAPLLRRRLRFFSPLERPG